MDRRTSLLRPGSSSSLLDTYLETVHKTPFKQRPAIAEEPEEEGEEEEDENVAPPPQNTSSEPKEVADKDAQKKKKKRKHAPPAGVVAARTRSRLKASKDAEANKKDDRRRRLLDWQRKRRKTSSTSAAADEEDEQAIKPEKEQNTSSTRIAASVTTTRPNNMRLRKRTKKGKKRPSEDSFSSSFSSMDKRMKAGDGREEEEEEEELAPPLDLSVSQSSINLSLTSGSSSSGVPAATTTNNKSIEYHLDQADSLLTRVQSRAAQAVAFRAWHCEVLRAKEEKAAADLKRERKKVGILEHQAATLQEQHKQALGEMSKDLSESLSEQHDEELRTLRQQHNKALAELKENLADALHEQNKAEVGWRNERIRSEMAREEVAMLKEQLAAETEARASVEHLKAQLAEAHACIEELKQKRHEDLAVRRALHEQVQALRGAIRVFCRIRPPTDAAKDGACVPAPQDVDMDEHVSHPRYVCGGGMDVSAHDGERLRVLAPEAKRVDGTARTDAKEFTFDRVFSPASTQAELFAELSELVTSCLDGFNVAIFAYGQTGSGKTHTMFGPPDRLDATQVTDERGLVPRAIEQVFATVKELESLGWTYELHASFVEVYNETIGDLLDGGSRLDVRTSSSGVAGVAAKQVSVSSPEQMQKLIARAWERRKVGATAMNERSSRSHSVFQLRVRGTLHSQQQSVTSCLSLVDLAGSERLDKSQATGDRRRETQMINSSLMALSNCVSAVAAKKQHVPFRNSKLTHLLQDSLRGNSKTAFFVNLAPDTPHYKESLCTLRFAEKLSACSLGAATKNVVP